MNFNPQVYQQVWQQLNQSLIITQKLNITTPIPIHIFETIPSTNTKVWQLIDSGIEMPVSAIALTQTAGKGQWGNVWVSATGGLYLSVGLKLDLPLHNYPHLVMATVWGVTTVLQHYQLPVKIKWFNDLILNQRKLGGIKIETRSSKTQIYQAVIGVGINWYNCVPDIGINLKSYYQQYPPNKIQSLEALAAITNYGIILGYQYYLAVGIEQLLTNYAANVYNIGQKIIINNCPGKIIGITSEGKIQIKLRSPGATTEITFAPGEITLGY
ncbi:biotin acetyl CoA carboxylase ligase [Chondrocystis sp. NIES-4102]|nr:biotin acetyl CoA carboxylase ligase [Chondrocystis sp. NIES-4102]